MTDEAQLAPTEPSGLTQFSYAIDDFNILLEPTVKTEIVEQRDIFPIPHAPEWCHGMISLRGKLIPVINIHRLLGRPSQNSSQWLLVIEVENLPPASIRIDHLPMQHQVQPDELLSINNGSLPFWIKRSADNDGEPIFQADHHALFELLILQNQQAQFQTSSTLEYLDSDSSGNKA